MHKELFVEVARSLPPDFSKKDVFKGKKRERASGSQVSLL